MLIAIAAASAWQLRHVPHAETAPERQAFLRAFSCNSTRGLSSLFLENRYRILSTKTDTPAQCYICRFRSFGYCPPLTCLVTSQLPVPCILSMLVQADSAARCPGSERLACLDGFATWQRTNLGGVLAIVSNRATEVRVTSLFLAGLHLFAF